MADIPVTPLVVNESVATGNLAVEQADIDQYDWLFMQLGLAGYGVISGCAVTQSGSGDMTVTVAPGLIQAGAQQLHVPGGVSAAFSASGTSPKYGLVEIHGTLATIVRNGGAAATAPVFPQPTAGNIVLAALTIGTSATQILTAQIADKRVFINNAFSTPGKLALHGTDWTRSRP